MQLRHSVCRPAIFLGAWSMCVACSGDDEPADVAGQYSVNVTNSESGCLPELPEGMSYSGINLVLTQDGSELTGTFEGLQAEIFLGILLGTNTFEGSVSGRTIELSRDGTVAATSGSCAFTVRAVARATVTGDLIEGKITYTPLTNDTADCDGIAQCRTVQAFNGTRPPAGN